MKKLNVFCVILGLLSSRLGSAASFEFVTQEQRTELRRDFSQARTPKLSEIKASWKCDMYGVRSALQVKRDVSLYQFKHNGEAFTNTGSMPVAEYGLSTIGLVGRQQKLQDEIRIMSDGTLIARLSTGPDILSYSLCH